MSLPSIRLLPLAALLLLLVPGGKEAEPAVMSLPAAAGSFRIEAQGLHIQPGSELNFLRFGPGVRISGEGISVRAETVEIDISTSGILDTSRVQLPQLSEAPERMIADPGQAVQEMAREIRGPSAKLEASALRRIAASGSVLIEGEGLRLSTATIYSADGGTSWSSGGAAELKLNDTKRGLRGSFSAQLISFNSSEQLLLARGQLAGQFTQAGNPELSFSAQELRADLKRNSIEITGAMTLQQGELRLETAALPGQTLKLALGQRQLNYGGDFVLSDNAQGLRLQGQGISGGLAVGGRLRIAAGVELSDTARGLRLKADALDAVLDPLKLTASGNVHLSYGKSSYAADEAVMTSSGSGKDTRYIIEIKGEQTGRFDLDELQRNTDSSPEAGQRQSASGD